MDWRDYIEKNTGEVSSLIVADSLGIDHAEVMNFVCQTGKHSARFVGGCSRWLIWKEDAEELERQRQEG